MCDYECKDASNWTKHKKTAKHKRNEEIEKEVEIRTRVAIEMEKLKIGHTTNNTYNTINNIDASNNININVFTPNPDAINLKDIVIPVLKELAKYKIVPATAIQKAVIDMGEKKPILYRNSSLYVKQNNKWEKDKEAERELDIYCRDTQHQFICELDNMSMDDELYVDAMELTYQPLDRDAVLHKVKTKLIQQ
jgi:hypothetical protein